MTDNIFDFELVNFVKRDHDINADSITTHALDDQEEMKRTGIAEVNVDRIVTTLEEKQALP